MSALGVIILAAGRGTRMKSGLPKALHPLGGRPMLGFLLENARGFSPKKIVVVAGHRMDLVKEFVGRRAIVVKQEKLLGSGHAVSQAAKEFSNFSGSVLVLYCDTPLVSAASLRGLLKNHRERSTDGSLLSARVADPSGYGRIRRAAGGFVERIVEETDAGPGEKAIREINAGCYVFKAGKLFDALKNLRRNAAKKEYYLTDVIALLTGNGGRVEAVEATDPAEIQGVNTRKDLALLEGVMRRRLIERCMEDGASFRDPSTTTVDAGVRIGQDTVICPHTVLEEDSVIGRGCRIGPFARIRGGSRIGDGVVIGNFVEIVRSKIGTGTQIKHLSYIGDAEIGSGVNIGAGTVTANYDGKKKHKTIVRDGAQIGSGTILIAPVVIGRKAKTGAGAVVTKNTEVPGGSVMVGIPARNMRKR